METVHDSTNAELSSHGSTHSANQSNVPHSRRKANRRESGRGSVVISRSENSAPDSGEVDMIYEETGLLGKIREIEEQCFVLFYLMLKHKISFISSPTASYVSLTWDFWFTLMLCFSEQIYWYSAMGSFEHVADAFLPSGRTFSISALHGVFVFVFIWFCITFMVFVYGVRAIQNQDVPHTNFVLFLRISFYALFEIGYQPLLSIILAPLDCSLESPPTLDGHEDVICTESPHIIYVFLSILCSVVYIASGLTYALVFFDAIPNKGSYLSRPLGRQEFVHTSLKTIMIIFHIFLNDGYVLAMFLFAANTVNFVVWIAYPMFHQTMANKVKAVYLGILCWTSIFAAIYGTPHNQDQYGPLVIYGILLPVVCGGSWYLAGRRLRKLHEKYSSLVNTSKDKEKFGFWYLVEISTRYSLYSGTFDEEKLESTKKMYMAGMKEFKKEAYLIVQYSLFLLAFDQSKDVAELQMFIYSVLGLRHETIDRRFLIAYLRKAWQQALEENGAGRSNDGLELSDHLYFKRQSIIAKHFQAEAKKSIYFFWRSLLHKSKDQGIEMKAEEFEYFETISLAAYEKLLKRFPAHITLLRNYGNFWLEIYHNNSISSEYFSIADELEQVQSEKRAHAALRSLGVANVVEGQEVGTGRKSEEVEVARSEHTVSTKERDRLRALKNRIINRNKKERDRESESVKNFARLLLILQLTLFAVPLAGYLIFDKFVSELDRNSYNLKYAHEQINQYEVVNYVVRSQTMNDLSVGTDDSICCFNSTCIRESRNKTLRTIHQMEQDNENLFKSMIGKYQPLRNFWTKDVFNVSVYLPQQQSFTHQQVSFIEMMSLYTTSARRILESEQLVMDFSQDADYRFIVDNGQDVLFPNLQRMGELYTEEELFLFDEFLIILGSLLAFLVLFLIIVASLWTPSYEKVREEVSALGKLRLLPRSALLEMCQKYRFKVDDDTDEDVENYQVTRSFSRDDQTNDGRRQKVFLFLILAGMVSCIVMWIVTLSNATHITPIATKSAERIGYAGSMYYRLRDLYLSHNRLDDKRNLLRKSEENMTHAHQDYMSLIMDSVQDEDFALKDCKIGDRLSLINHLTLYVFEVNQLSFQATTMNDTERLSYARSHFPYDGLRSPRLDCMLKISEHYQTKVISAHQESRSFGNIYFWLIWPLFMYYFAYRMPLAFKNKVKNATSRSTRIIKMIPTKLIDLAPKLKDHLIEHKILAITDFDDYEELEELGLAVEEEIEVHNIPPSKAGSQPVGLQAIPLQEASDEDENDSQHQSQKANDPQQHRENTLSPPLHPFDMRPQSRNSRSRQSKKQRLDPSNQRGSNQGSQDAQNPPDSSRGGFRQSQDLEASSDSSRSLPHSRPASAPIRNPHATLEGLELNPIVARGQLRSVSAANFDVNTNSTAMGSRNRQGKDVESISRERRSDVYKESTQSETIEQDPLTVLTPADSARRSSKSYQPPTLENLVEHDRVTSAERVARSKIVSESNNVQIANHEQIAAHHHNHDGVRLDQLSIRSMSLTSLAVTASNPNTARHLENLQSTRNEAADESNK
eukprot:TRINITY_DN3578_c0_g1_i13.p1 TRINITY_DN3578_c0_g1~~TRINITY_DN3578_c0_g1_i13.p1  ORF type:complete len:1547 (+),score=332.31 TRINITY_DN3578_c0_g1_i13:213-4853(+)